MNIIQVYKTFPTQDDCLDHLEKVRWNSKPKCPYCASTRVTPMKGERRHHCNNCNTSFSVTVKTIFHKSKLELQKWFLAISLILNAKKGIAARQLARDLEVTKDTAWYMAMRIRRAMIETPSLLSGIVEMDETYVGGKPRKGDPMPNKRGRGTKKTPVVGMVQRGGEIKAKVMRKDKLTAKELSSIVREKIDVDRAVLVTDEYRGYCKISDFMPQFTINHQLAYADGDIHTNTMEGFWSLFKRGIVGQFHKVSVFHLPRYVDEFCFRYNNRMNEHAFDFLLSRALGGAE